jgi:hypothetical protein
MHRPMQQAGALHRVTHSPINTAFPANPSLTLPYFGTAAARGFLLTY